MTVITLSTIGFGEVHPLSDAGRVFTSVLIVGGLGTALYSFARVGQAVFEGEILSVLGRRRMERDLKHLSDHYIVCGFGRIGHHVAHGLAREGLPFCVIDNDPTLADEMRGDHFLFYLGDATDEDVLRAAGIERAKTLLALLSSDADNLYLTMAAKELNPGVQVIARALEEDAIVKLRRGGADKVVSPYEMAGLRLLVAAVRPTVLEFIELLTRPDFDALTMEEVPVCVGSALEGAVLGESPELRDSGAMIVGIKRASGELRFNPTVGEHIGAGDTLIALGERESLKRLGGACAQRG